MARTKRWIFVAELGEAGEWKKRCLSTAPVHGDQCQHRRKHNKTDLVITHRAGSLVWYDNGRHKHEPTINPVESWIDKALRGVFDTHVPTYLDPSSVFRPLKDRLGADPTYAVKDETHIFRHGGHLYGFDHIPPIWSMPPVDLGPNHERRKTEMVAPEPVVDMDATTSGDTHVVSGAQRAREASRRPVPLEQWWRQVSEDEIAATVPKAIEYGATDLIDIGVQLGKWMKRPLTDAEAAEFGCWFYLIGKMARATSAQDRGEMPSDDTLKDIGVYVKMIQRIRAAGSWPGEELDPDQAGGSTLNREEQD